MYILQWQHCNCGAGANPFPFRHLKRAKLKCNQEIIIEFRNYSCPTSTNQTPYCYKSDKKGTFFIFFSVTGDRERRDRNPTCASGRLAVPEKILSLESRASCGSAASLASCAGDLGVQAAAHGSAPPICFPASTTRSCSAVPSTHLCAQPKKIKITTPQPGPDTSGTERSPARGGGRRRRGTPPTRTRTRRGGRRGAGRRRATPPRWPPWEARVRGRGVKGGGRAGACRSPGPRE